jgi:hypothetical protein
MPGWCIQSAYAHLWTCGVYSWSIRGVVQWCTMDIGFRRGL